MPIFMSHLHRNSRICLDYSSLHFSNYFVHLVFNTRDSRQILALEWQTVIALGFAFCKIFEIKILHKNKKFFKSFLFHKLLQNSHFLQSLCTEISCITTPCQRKDAELAPACPYIHFLKNKKSMIEIFIWPKLNICIYFPTQKLKGTSANFKKKSLY